MAHGHARLHTFANAEHSWYMLSSGLVLVHAGYDTIASSCVNSKTMSMVLLVQMKVSPVKVFVVHLEVQTADENVHRISISSMYRESVVRVRHDDTTNMHSTQLPCVALQ